MTLENMLNERSLKKEFITVSFHLSEILEELQLIYDGKKNLINETIINCDKD